MPDPPVVDQTHQVVATQQSDLLLSASDPIKVLEAAQHIVQAMGEKCEGEQFISVISGRRYPKVEWWTAVGSVLGVFPYEESCERLATDDESCKYLAIVQIRRGDQVIGRGSGLCSSKEEKWSNRDEHAIRSMSITRATGKAYRLAMSYLPVLAGMEATPAEEMPDPDQRQQQRRRTTGTPTPAPNRKPIRQDVVHVVKTQSHITNGRTRYGITVSGGTTFSDQHETITLGTYDQDKYQGALDAESGGMAAQVTYQEQASQPGKYNLIDINPMVGPAKPLQAPQQEQPQAESDKTSVIDMDPETGEVKLDDGDPNKLLPKDLPF